MGGNGGCSGSGSNSSGGLNGRSSCGCVCSRVMGV